MTLHPILRKCWMKRGKQKKVPAAGKQQTHHIVGAFNYVTGEVIWTTAENKNTDAFVEFLEHFMNTIDTSIPTVLLLDNASYHHSKLTEATLAFFEKDGLISFWLPPYCSNLNFIERFWGYLKSFACPNKLFESLSDLVDSVDQFLNHTLSPWRLLCHLPKRF